MGMSEKKEKKKEIEFVPAISRENGERSKEIIYSTPFGRVVVRKIVFKPKFSFKLLLYILFGLIVLGLGFLIGSLILLLAVPIVCLLYTSPSPRD